MRLGAMELMPVLVGIGEGCSYLGRIHLHDVFSSVDPTYESTEALYAIAGQDP